MSLPEFLQPYFASYDLSRLDKKADKAQIITQILVWGDGAATKWLLKNYELDELREVVKKPSRGMWTRQALNYWQKVLDVDIPAEQYSTAIMDLDPRPEVYERIIP